MGSDPLPHFRVERLSRGDISDGAGQGFALRLGKAAFARSRSTQDKQFLEYGHLLNPSIAATTSQSSAQARI